MAKVEIDIWLALKIYSYYKLYKIGRVETDLIEQINNLFRQVNLFLSRRVNISLIIAAANETIYTDAGFYTSLLLFLSAEFAKLFQVEIHSILKVAR